MAKYSVLKGLSRSLGSPKVSKLLSGCSLRTTLPFTQIRLKSQQNAPVVGDYGTFKFSELKVSLASPEQLKPKPDVSQLLFGKSFTDHMFEAEWQKATGWSRPKICPLHDLPIHPAAKVLHYAIELFDGMKAYRGVDGKLRLFRPDMNVQRLLRGARRALLPGFDPDEFLSCLKRLIRIEEEWIPHSETSSLYIRPTFIGTDPTLGVSSSAKALLFVITCPTGPYFSKSFQTIALLADPKYVRAWPGGVGSQKFGSNYGPTVYVQKQAEDMGVDQVLWLYGENHLITEIGTMNIFVVIRNSKGERELITPPLDGLILPGITRQSILDLSRQWNEFKVSERSISMDEITKLVKEKRVLEVFGAGTACIVCPVNRISYLGVDYHIPTTEQNDIICARLVEELSAIHYGRKSHEWGVLVD